MRHLSAPPADAAVAATTAQCTQGVMPLSHTAEAAGTTTNTEAAPGQSEPGARKRKLPASLAAAAAGPAAAPPLTIRSLAAPRKPAVPPAHAARRAGAAVHGERRLQTGSGAGARPEAAPQQQASAQREAPFRIPPAGATPAAPAIKPQGPRRLPASLLQPPSAGAATTHCCANTLQLSTPFTRRFIADLASTYECHV